MHSHPVKQPNLTRKLLLTDTSLRPSTSIPTAKWAALLRTEAVVSHLGVFGV
jgi:hypothetical protein